MPEMKRKRTTPRSRRGSLRSGRAALIGALALAGAVDARAAWATVGEQCATAYEQAQELRRGGGLVEARAQLLTCTSASCPTFITADCRRWLDEVESALPSVVFAARRLGRDLELVQVKADGRLVTERLDGRAVAIDPGKHSFTFTAPGSPEVRVDAIINEGSKHRLITVDIPMAPAPPALRVSDADRRREAPTMRPLTRGLFVVGALGVVGFAGLGLWGLHDERRLRDECAPGCAPTRVDRVHRQYIAADLSLAVGVVALGLGAYFHRWHGTEGPPRFALRLVEGGGTLSVGERF
jgi:hypothetical protein